MKTVEAVKNLFNCQLKSKKWKLYLFWAVSLRAMLSFSGTPCSTLIKPNKLAVTTPILKFIIIKEYNVWKVGVLFWKRCRCCLQFWNYSSWYCNRHVFCICINNWMLDPWNEEYSHLPQDIFNLLPHQAIREYHCQ